MEFLKIHCLAARISAAFFFANLAFAQIESKPESIQVSMPSSRTAFFPGETITFNIRVLFKEPFFGNLQWRHSILHRTLNRGIKEVSVVAGQSIEFQVRLIMPELKPGVSQKTSFELFYMEDGRTLGDPVLSKDMWILATDPFFDRRGRLREIGVNLFDPMGKLATNLHNLEVPIKKLSSLSAARDSIGTLLVAVGEDKGMGLAKTAVTLYEIASSGKNVLWFPSKTCSLLLPGSSTILAKQPHNLVLRSMESIFQLDSRINFSHSNKDQSSTSKSILLAASNDRVKVDLVDGALSGWGLIEFEFAHPHGRLIIIGYDLTSAWESSPLPRYIFAQLLDHWE